MSSPSVSSVKCPKSSLKSISSLRVHAHTLGLNIATCLLLLDHSSLLTGVPSLSPDPSQSLSTSQSELNFYIITSSCHSPAWEKSRLSAVIQQCGVPSVLWRQPGITRESSRLHLTLVSSYAGPHLVPQMHQVPSPLGFPCRVSPLPATIFPSHFSSDWSLHPTSPQDLIWSV